MKKASRNPEYAETQHKNHVWLVTSFNITMTSRINVRPATHLSIYYINSEGLSVFAQYFNTLIVEIFVIKGFINQHRLGSAFS